MDRVAEATRWLDENWDPEITVGEWWRLLADSGWGYPTWPSKWFGRDAKPAEARAIRQVFAERNILGPPSGIGPFLAAPTLFAHGTEDQLARYMPGIAYGTEIWCQLFSEPGAGSDLASLATRAERDGDEYRVNGQKVWNTNAQYAKYAILVARTDPDQPKHKGLSYFAFDMTQPGVEVRPLKEMTGASTFNEVFMSDARVNADDMIGQPGEGWRVTMTTLSNERDSNNPASGGGGGSFVGAPPLDETTAQALEPPVNETPDGFELALSGGARHLPFDTYRDFSRADDPVARDSLTQLHVLNEVMRFSNLRARSRARSGQGPGPESSTGKLMGTKAGRLMRELGLMMQGPYGQLVDEDAPYRGALQAYGLFVPASSIAGGSDEVQRNIIGERILGLPKEPDLSRDLPWRDVPR